MSGVKVKGEIDSLMPPRLIKAVFNAQHMSMEAEGESILEHELADTR